MRFMIANLLRPLIVALSVAVLCIGFAPAVTALQTPVTAPDPLLPRTSEGFVLQQKLTANDYITENYDHYLYEGFGSDIAFDSNFTVVANSRGDIYAYTGAAPNIVQEQIISRSTSDLNYYCCGIMLNNGLLERTSSNNTTTTIEFYRHSSNGWSLDQTLTVASSHSCQGIALDNTTMLIGGLKNQGKCSFNSYAYINNAWSLQQQITLPAGTEIPPAYGAGFRLGLAGNTIFIGVPYVNNYQGTVFVYTRTNGLWSLSQQLLAADGTANDWYGSSLAIDGNLLAIGALYDGSGSVYMYDFDGQLWSLNEKLLPPSSGYYYGNENFGSSVSIHNGTMVVLDPSYPIGENEWAAVYRLFNRVNGHWILTDSLIPFPGEAYGGALERVMHF